MARILWRPVSAVIKMLIGSVLAAFILGMLLTVETGENVFHIMFRSSLSSKYILPMTCAIVGFGTLMHIKMKNS